MLSLGGKVAVVTGAGGGIGRAIALLLARYDARVVVNDLGAASDGTGKDIFPANDTVQAIKELGGEAVPDCHSVASMEGGQAIIQTALDSFGRIDILVNNAGILRDRILFKMSEEEWEAVIGVHLKGTFACTRAAAPLMKEQRGGRIINFTSTSGLFGNVGQANYAAAKMGIVGFTRVCALDMARYNVTANCVAPTAWTRLVGTIPIETEDMKKKIEKLQKMSPAHIAPLVVFLASDRAQFVSGQIFGVRGKEILLYSQPRPIRSVHRDEGWTPETAADVFEGSIKHDLIGLVSSIDYFSYEPLI